MPDHITATDDIIQHLNFMPFQNSVERSAFQFLPDEDEPQSTPIHTSWEETLICESGDYIVSELDAPLDRWPVNKEIFENSYREIRPGVYVKRSLTYLVPLVDVTGDPDSPITVCTLEGPVIVKAGDFYLARGILGEIWPYPKDKAEATLQPVFVAEMV